MGSLHPIDAVVIAAYGLVVVAIGVRANRGQRTTEDYFLAGRSLRWWAVGVSLIATSFSGSALIGGTGIGFARGMGYLQLQLGDLLAIGIACALFLPYFARLRLTSAYEVLEDRFGPLARTAGSLLFIAQTLARTAILVYGPAIAIHAVLGWSMVTAIWVTSAAAVLYSALGGIAAVVWTDLLQLCVVLVAVFASVVLVAGDVPGGLAAVVEHAGAAHRLEAVTLRADDFSTPFNLTGALLAYGTLALSVAGTNQQAVQRYMACTDLGAARRAALLGWLIGAVAVAATLFLGVCLEALTQLAPGSLEVPEKADEILPAFVLARMPPGLAGLVVAAVFAAAMSSLDSAVHSLSTCTIVDFFRRYGRERSEAEELRLARRLTVGFGVVAALGATYAAEREATLLETLIEWLGYFAGPLVGLFLLAILTRRVRERAALAGAAVAGALVAWAVHADRPAELGLTPLWLAPWGAAVTFVVAWSVAVLFTGRRP